MGKRGASAAAASGADDGNHVDAAEADDLMVRVARWRREHPTRDYVRLGAPIEQQAVSPAAIPQIAGGVYTRRVSRTPARSAASGAPTEWAIDEEVVCVPFAQKILQGQEIKKVGWHRDELFSYQDSASGEWFQDTTSMERVLALATTEPMVKAWPDLPLAVESGCLLRWPRGRVFF